MKIQKIIGILALLAGVVMIGFSMYIKKEVAEGTLQVTEGEKKINTANTLFSLTPETRRFGSQLTESGNKKIAAGKEEIARYSALANQLQIGGIILIVVGAGVVFFAFRKKRR